ncbi:MAG: beta-propeller fold lactonase family protein, partial [Candidatus Sulfotelmatobacter sp.]
YVANAGPGSNQNTVSAFTICSSISLLSQPPCPVADFSLHSISACSTATGFCPAGDVPGPMSVDAYGKFLYVVNKGSSNISGYEINSNTGALLPFSGAPVAAGVGPNSIAIRSDDSWVFVANTGYPGTLSQYSISLTSGILSPVGPVSTLDYPSGVAVK